MQARSQSAIGSIRRSVPEKSNITALIMIRPLTVRRTIAMFARWHAGKGCAMTSVAVLGTGIMGAPMAGNLARAGHDVRVWNRTRAKAEPLAKDGARVVDEPAEAVEGAEVVLTMLFDGAAVTETMSRAAAGLRPGTVWVQSTTVGIDELPGFARFAADHGLVLVDAPVRGPRQPAESGQLTVIAAGPDDIRPVV